MLARPSLRSGTCHPPRLLAHVLPLVFQAFFGDGDAGAELLGEQRDAEFFDHKAEVDQVRIVDFPLLML